MRSLPARFHRQGQLEGSPSRLPPGTRREQDFWLDGGAEPTAGQDVKTASP